MRAASVCSGVGTDALASEGLGWEHVWFAEVDPFASAVLAARFPDVPNLGDLTAIDGAVWRGAIDLLSGGTPCQAFSVAGRRESLDDARGNLTLAFVELCHAIDPRFVVWENVPGVLSTRDNAFGCFLAGLAGSGTALVPERGQRWTDAGLVVGPRRAVAWRVLDAQYFGLAQRRRRVFVVSVRAREWWRAAEILFESDCLPGHPPSREEAREAVAGTLGGGSGERGWSPDTDRMTFVPEVAADEANIPLPEPIPIQEASDSRDKAQGSTGVGKPGDVMYTLHSSAVHGVAIAGTIQANSGRCQADATYVAHTLRGEGFDASEDGTGRGTPLVPMAFEWQASPCNTMNPSRVAPSLKKGTAPAVFAFDESQVTSPGNRSNPKPGDPCHTLTTDGRAPAIASAEAVSLRGRDGGGTAELSGDLAPALRASGGGGDKAHALVGWAVRRLTPTECERLQGYPDGHTLVPYRGKVAKDGPRYKAIGNGWARTVAAWLFARIDAAARATATDDGTAATAARRTRP